MERLKSQEQNPQRIGEESTCNIWFNAKTGAIYGVSPHMPVSAQNVSRGVTRLTGVFDQALGVATGMPLTKEKRTSAEIRAFYQVRQYHWIVYQERERRVALRG